MMQIMFVLKSLYIIFYLSHDPNSGCWMSFAVAVTFRVIYVFWHNTSLILLLFSWLVFICLLSWPFCLSRVISILVGFQCDVILFILIFFQKWVFSVVCAFFHFSFSFASYFWLWFHFFAFCAML